MSETVYTAICAVCGYQWDETAESTFFLFCPACDANMVNRCAPTKPDEMGEDYDVVPWF